MSTGSLLCCNKRLCGALHNNMGVSDKTYEERKSPHAYYEVVNSTIPTKHK